MSIRSVDADEPPERAGLIDQPIADVLCDLDITPTSQARRVVRDLLDGHDDAIVYDAMLIVEELVANAVRHAASPRRCRIRLIHGGRLIRIEVDDATPARLPYARLPDRTGGRGIPLIDRLSTSWGAYCHSGRKTVWAELALDDFAT